METTLTIKDKAFEKLLGNLEELTKQYRALLDCVRKEKDLLIGAEIEKLNENNAHKDQLLLKIRSLDGLRVNYATELAQIVGADTVQPRLLELAQKLGGAQGERLRSLHSTLEIVITRLNDLNKNNAQYAESALKTVNATMENFKEQLMGQKTYQKKGAYQQGYDKSGHLVRKEA